MLDDYLNWERYVIRSGVDLPEEYRHEGRVYRLAPADRLYVAGMGGSGVVGDLIRDLSTVREWPFEAVVVKDYFFRGRDGLMLAVSYSGNTAETLTAAAAALRRGMPVIAITTGGKLAEMGVPVVKVPKASAPRAALPQMLTAALWVLKRIYGIDFDVPSSLPYNEGLVDRLIKILGARPTIVAPASMQGLAYRVKNEVNENAKLDPLVEILPEAHHNWIEGASGPIMALTSPDIPAEHRMRVKLTIDLLSGEVFEVPMTVGGILTFLKHVGVATVKIALGRGIDPLRTPRIDELKRRLP
ncbi:MAG: bifunctional phosphoglucose/phosphomannose isomerase [Thermoproteus sp.]